MWMSVEPSRIPKPYACRAFSTELCRNVTCCVARIAGQWPTWNASHRGDDDGMARDVGERVIVLDLDLDEGCAGRGKGMRRGKDGRVGRVPSPIALPVPAGLERRGRVRIGRGRGIERDRIIDLRVGRREGESRNGARRGAGTPAR